MHADIAISTNPSASSTLVGASHIQPPSAAGSPPRIYSQEEHSSSAFAESTNFTDALNWSDATALNALRDQIRQIEAIDSNHQAEIVNVFRTLKESAGVIKRTLAKAPDDVHLWRLGDALVALLRQFNYALRKQPDLSSSLDAHDIRSICLGLSACANPTAGIVFDEAQQRRAGPALQGITDSLLTQLAVLGMPESASANGVVLDILNWVSHGLKTGFLESNALIRTSYGQALELFAGWLNGNHTHGFMTVKQVAKCAVQIDLMVKRKLVALKTDSPGGPANRTLLAQCATGLGSAGVLVQFDTAPASSSDQGAVDAVALINVCNAFNRLLDARLLGSDNSALAAPLSRLLALILCVPSPQLCAGTGQTLSNCGNFVRTLFDLVLSAEPGLAPLLEKASTHLIATVNGPDFAQGNAGAQTVSNLMSFVKLCNKRLQAKVDNGMPDQVALIAAAGVLYGQLMLHDPAQFRGAEAIGGLLSGLCYLWRSGMVALSGTEWKWVDTLMRSVAAMDKKSWDDKSREVMLPALLALIEMGRLTLAAAQPALAVLSKEPASASSGYTLADLAQSVERLGAIEETVVALPPGVIVHPASAPAPAPLLATLPRAIPGDTPLATPPAASQPARSTPAPVQRRTPGGTAQDQWRTPAKVARHGLLPMSTADVHASQPTWSDAATSTALSSTTTRATTANSTTTSTTTTGAAKPARKKTKASKGAPTATRAAPQKPAQQWFALLTNKSGIDLKRLQDLARSQPGLLNKNDASGRNALFHAIAAGNEKVVAWLIAHESYVAPEQPARFLTLLMEEVIFFSPAFGAALRCFLERQTAPVKRGLLDHFARNPPIMRGVEDILAAYRQVDSTTVSVDATPVAKRLAQPTPGQSSSLTDQELLQHCVKRAEQGNAQAQLSCGFYYQHGRGVAKDEVKAVRFYQLAAEQGLADAQNALGYCHQKGLGMAKDEKEAVRWYQLAAKQGLAASQFTLGFCYQSGRGVAKDEKKAVHWYQLAAEQGEAGAQGTLGFCYQLGTGVAKDEKKAVHWYQLAANQGLAEAQNAMGFCYQHGLGVAKDEKKAVHWYQLAARQGNAEAQFNLGNCYQDGVGVTKDEKEAARWYQLAAEQGYTSN